MNKQNFEVPVNLNMKFILSSFLAEHKHEVCLACANAIFYHFYSKSRQISYSIDTFLPLAISTSLAGSLPLINISANSHRTWILRVLLGIPIIYCHILGGISSADHQDPKSAKIEQEKIKKKIMHIHSEAIRLRAEMEEWSELKPGKTFLYFEQNFLKLVDDLDGIITTDIIIKRHKRLVIKYLQECLDFLDDGFVM